MILIVYDSTTLKVNDSLMSFILLVDRKKIRYFYTFKELLTPEEGDPNIVDYFKPKYSGIQTYAILSPSICSNPKYVEQLVDIGLIPNTQNAMIEIHHRLSRILFQPRKSLINEAREFIKNNTLENCVGIQYRTGGNTSIFFEYSTFLSLDAVVESAKLLKIAFSNKNRTIFLTTDSNKVQMVVPKLMKPLKVRNVKKYSIGHSYSWRRSYARLTNTMNRILMDLYIFSSCDAIFWTRNSSFGELGYWLSNSHIAYQIDK